MAMLKEVQIKISRFLNPKTGELILRSFKRPQESKTIGIVKKGRYGILEKEIEKALKEKPKTELSPYEKVIAAKKIMETSILKLSDDEKRKKLEAIEASSEWSAFYDYQAYPPREAFQENEELFLAVPYFKAGLFLRAEMSVGVGIKKISDGTSDTETPQEKYIKEEFDRLDLEKKLITLCLYRDLYGNAYLYKEWITDLNGKKYLKAITVLFPPRVRIRMDKEDPGKIIGYAYLPPIFVPGQFYQPVPMELTDCIHFRGETYDDLPYGYSKVRPLVRVLQARRDINIMEPLIYKNTIKPWLHYQFDGENLGETKIDAEINGMITQLSQAGPESDLVTSKRWTVNSFSAAQAKNDNTVKTLIEDQDNQIFGELKIPETYFKPKGTTDRMILKQDDNFSKEMKRIQHYFGWQLREELIVELLENKFGPPTTYKVPEIEWNDILEVNAFERNTDTRETFKSGIITKDEARKEMDLPPIEEATQGQQVPGAAAPSTDLDYLKNKLTLSSKKKQVIEDGEVRLTLEER